MQPNDSTPLSDALAHAERAILEPIVEGEVALRTAGMHTALAELQRQIGPPPSAPAMHNPAADDIMQEHARLAAQLRELCTAADALQRRAARVEPDEKRVQDEVDAFIVQARQFLTALRQFQQAKHAVEIGATP